MSAILKSIDDPRDSLDKATRDELSDFAKARGVSEINPNMPAILMRQILRRNGVTDIRIVPRVLGQPDARPITTDQGHEADMIDDLARQWAEQQEQAPSFNGMGINDLRDECKKRGISMKRTDKIADLRAKLENSA